MRNFDNSRIGRLLAEARQVALADPPRPSPWTWLGIAVIVGEVVMAAAVVLALFAFVVIPWSR